MGFRFRKSIKIVPGLKINIGKKGFSSITVGGKGASITTGKRGIYANVGIPGTGLSYRQKIGETPKKNASIVQVQPVTNREFLEGQSTEEKMMFFLGFILGMLSLFILKKYLWMIFAFPLSLFIGMVIGVIFMIVCESSKKEKDSTISNNNTNMDVYKKSTYQISHLIGNDDPLYHEVKDFVLSEGKVSISNIKRKFNINFNRALSIVEALKMNKVI